MTSFTADEGQRVAEVETDSATLRVRLRNGEWLSVPLAWYPRLLAGTAEQRGRWEVAGAGFGIHWPELDEDLSVEGLLNRLPAPGLQPAGVRKARVVAS